MHASLSTPTWVLLQYTTRPVALIIFCSVQSFYKHFIYNFGFSSKFLIEYFLDLLRWVSSIEKCPFWDQQCSAHHWQMMRGNLKFSYIPRKNIFINFPSNNNLARWWCCGVPIFCGSPFTTLASHEHYWKMSWQMGKIWPDEDAKFACKLPSASTAVRNDRKTSLFCAA